MKQRPINVERASRIATLLERDYEEAADWAATISDALADLRHLCDRHDLDFGDLDRVAYDHYCAERHASDAEAQDSEAHFKRTRSLA